jgi:uncharacterized protein (TIGR03545 family)
MKRWIRPQGVLLFLLFLVSIAALALFLSGPILGRAIERGGTAAVGARVDVDSARLSFFPLGFNVTGLQVTNPKEPMENTVEVGRIALKLDTGALIRRKLLVDEMTLVEMAFGTPRETSGAVVKQGSRETLPKEQLRFPSLKIPSVSEILGQEELTSVTLSEELRTRAARVEEGIGNARESLPDKAKVNDYRKRLDALLSDTGLDKARLSEAEKLRDEIRSERDRVRAVEKRITGDVADLRAGMSEVRESVGKDVERIGDKYAFTPEGLSNFSGLIFGPKARKWTQRTAQALKILDSLPRGSESGPKTAQPPRGKGVDIPLTEKRPLPDFLIKKAALSFRVPSGAIEGEALDFTLDQTVQKKPSTFALAGRELPGGASLEAEGKLDRTDPSSPRDDLKIRYEGWSVSDLSLAEGDGFPVTLNQGSGTLLGEVVLKGSAMEGTVQVDLSSVSLEAGDGKSGSPLGQAIGKALRGVGEISLTVHVSGNLDDPRVRITSNLDRVLTDAAGQAAREESRRLRAALREGIEGRTGPTLDEAAGSLQRLEDARSEIGAIKADLEETLKTKVKLPF